MNESKDTVKYRPGLRPSSFIKMPEIKFKNVKFSEKQILVLENVAEGLENKDIAAILKVSIRTIEAHIYNIRKMLSKELGHKLSDREIVLFAKEMINGFTKFIEHKFTQPESKNTITTKNGIEIIEDWDQDEDEEEEQFTPIKPKDGDDGSSFQMNEFTSEEIIPSTKMNNFCFV